MLLFDDYNTTFGIGTYFCKKNVRFCNSSFLIHGAAALTPGLLLFRLQKARSPKLSAFKFSHRTDRRLICRPWLTSAFFGLPCPKIPGADRKLRASSFSPQPQQQEKSSRARLFLLGTTAKSYRLFHINCFTAF